MKEPPSNTPTRNAVCLCVDKNMLVPALFVADAARALRTKVADYDVLLVTTSPEDATDVHRRWLAEREIRLRDDFDLSDVHDIDMMNSRLTKATLLKLLLAQNLAGSYDKLLYLDADVSLHEEIAAIFSLDMKGFPLAATPLAKIQTGWNWNVRKLQLAHYRELGMTEPYRFINTGVLLIHVDEWNRTEIGLRAIRFIRANPNLCLLPDEDSLNAILDGFHADLSPVWNMQGASLSYRGIREIVEPVIIHYFGVNKPWKRFGTARRLFEYRSAYRLYQDFVAGTPWPTWLEQQWNGRDLWDNLLFELQLISQEIKPENARARRAKRLALVEGFAQYCRETEFADVDQGIVRREGDRLRLNRSSGRIVRQQCRPLEASPFDRQERAS